MSDIFSNSPAKDFVLKPFQDLIRSSSRSYLATPYFTAADDILNAAKAGKSIALLVGLNPSTSPEALGQVFNVPNIALRYLTGRFHAKLFIFDDEVLVGSSNLTEGGLFRNREAMVRLNSVADLERIEDLKALFADLWEAAEALSENTLITFRLAVAFLPKAPSPEEQIEKAIGRVEPRSVSVESLKKTKRRLFEMELRREVNEQYRPAFSEVTDALERNGLRRADLAELSASNETFHFLGWIRLSYVRGDESWQSAELKPADQRHGDILKLGQEWKETKDSFVQQSYFDRHKTVERTFGSREAISLASKEEITRGLISLHAFEEQLRFTKGGLQNLPKTFWGQNADHVERVRRSIAHLVHDPGDFIVRLHDLLYDKRYKRGLFGRFCALELYGTIKPSECPPMNGRVAKALRYLGFDVKAS